MKGKIMEILTSKIAKIIGGCVVLIAIIFLSSFTAVKINSSNSKSIKVASDIVGQLSDQYLAPKFDAINAQLETMKTDVNDIKTWTEKKDVKEYKALVKLIDKQYEKYNRDKADIKIADLKEIDDNWADLPSSYKTAMVIREYDIAMQYYLSIK